MLLLPLSLSLGLFYVIIGLFFLDMAALLVKQNHKEAFAIL